jgi:hypothetical protein
MASPVIATLNVNAPPDEGLPPDDLPFIVAISAEQRTVQRLKLTGSGSKVVDFGTIGSAGAKLVVVSLETGVGVLPITCRFNGAAGNMEVSPGGFFCVASPLPVAGVFSMEIFHTANAAAKVWIFG